MYLSYNNINIHLRRCVHCFPFSNVLILYTSIHSFLAINEAGNKESVRKEIFEYNSFFIHDPHCQNSQWLLSVLVICMFRFYYQNIVLLIVQNGQYAVHPNFTCRLVHFLFCRGRYDFFLANCCDWFIDVNVSQTHSVIFFVLLFIKSISKSSGESKMAGPIKLLVKDHTAFQS